ncbi:MAG: UDP-N-acetylmuramoyl-L-alanine--D-glutamate ligase [Defluviitaleaceae bacterium]|nr:UDP-N-acetylmuramoyl-L-alanine--D-glutamate ligase [Defluviitaleaceae bacterium]
MEHKVEYRGKNVLVCGMARSGIAAALFLDKLGANVTLQDIKEKPVSKEISQTNIKLHMGENPDKIIQDFDAIILSPGIPYNTPFVQAAKQAGIYVIGEFELGTQLYNGPFYAITGTNGKTTTTMLASHIIGQNGPVVTAGNIGQPITKQISQKFMPCVAEVSSFQLETVHTFCPQVAVVLNLSEDHLDRHVTMDNYGSIKENIFREQKKENYVILNYDNDYTKNMANRAKSKVIFFSTKSKQDIYFWNNNIIAEINGETTTINIENFKLLGSHNIENAMAAIGIGILAGITEDVIQNAVDTFEQPQHRLEYIETINNINYYNDSKATNPQASVTSIEALQAPIILIAGGLAKKADYIPWATAAATKAKLVVAIGQDKDKIMQVCQGRIDALEANTLEEALDLAEKSAEPGDNILLSPACASFDMFKDYEHRGRVFKRLVKNKR